jgi:hypothetical protein
MIDKAAVVEVENEFRELFAQLSSIQDTIRQKLFKGRRNY